jgi:hypothetical protein
MARKPAGKASIVSSQKVAEEPLPWMNRTGVPSSAPLLSAWTAMRGVWIIWDVMPGRVGIELIGFLLSIGCQK